LNASQLYPVKKLQMFHSHPAMSSNKGFTLLEVLVVAIIIALLALIAVPYYLEYKQEAMAQEAFLQLTEWGDMCILKAIRSYETTPEDEEPTYPQPPEKPENGQYFYYSHNFGTVENVILTARGIKGDLTNKTLSIHVRVHNGYPSKRFGGSLF